MEVVKIIKLDLSNVIGEVTKNTDIRNAQIAEDTHRRKKDLISVAGTLVLGMIDIHKELKRIRGKILFNQIEECLNRSDGEAFETLLNKGLEIDVSSGKVSFNEFGVSLWHIENPKCMKATNLKIQTLYKIKYGDTIEQILHTIIQENF